MQKAVLPVVRSKTCSIDRLCLDIPQSKSDWHSFESETIWSPVPLTDVEKELVASVTQGGLSGEEITAEMGHACSSKTVQRLAQSMECHKRIPRRKPNVRLGIRLRRV